MKLSKFEEKCTLAGLKIKARADFDGIVAIVADGYSNGAAEMKKPHYRTVYAIGRSPQDLNLMQSIYHEFGDGFGKHDKEKERIQDAFEAARMAAKALRDGGIIKG